MGHYLPVFFFPIKVSEAARECSTWNDGVRLIEQYFGEHGEHLWQSLSQNCWHQFRLGNFATALCTSSTLTESTNRKEISKSPLYGRVGVGAVVPLPAPESGPDFSKGVRN